MKKVRVKNYHRYKLWGITQRSGKERTMYYRTLKGAMASVQKQLENGYSTFLWVKDPITNKWKLA